MDFARWFVPAALAAGVIGAQGQFTNSVGSSEGTQFARTSGFNPDVSAILDVFYHDDDTDHGIAELLGELQGFAEAHHADAEHSHAHEASPRQGFNLRHIELVVSAAVDPYARGMVNVAVTEDSAELEEAWFETLALPHGLKLKGGKFYSDMGYLNPQHPHQWDFVDQPLVYRLLLGDHNLNDAGLQLSWLAPLPWYVLAGAEAFQGDLDAFAYHGDEPLPTHDAPRIGVGWIKLGPPLPSQHGLQLGLFGVVGRLQQEHDGDGDGEPDHWLDGNAKIWGADLVYKYDAPRPYGEGDFTLQAEYARRDRDLDVVAHDLRPELIGRALDTAQDGYYVQAVYGVVPRWRVGVRWEQLGLTNRDDLPTGNRETYDSSWKASAMVDFTPSEFSRFRVQISRGRYELEDGPENATELYLQAMFSIGAHGAHKF